MSIADKLQTIVENEQKVYNAGYEKGKAEGGSDSYYDDFWDSFQDNGNRTDYRTSFTLKYWNETTFKPKYLIKPVGSANSMFSQFNMQSTLQQSLFDFTDVPIDVSEVTDAGGLFANACVTNLVLKFSESVKTLDNAFTKGQGGGVAGMHLTLLVPNANCTWNNTFSYHRIVRLILLEGTVIGKNGFNVQWATALPKEDLIGILNALEDKTSDTSGTQWVVTLGTTNLAKLTDIEKAIATEKGWTLA